MRYLATGFIIPALPNRSDRVGDCGADCGISADAHHVSGRAVYGIGNRERAAYLSGINTAGL